MLCIDFGMAKAGGKKEVCGRWSAFMELSNQVRKSCGQGETTVGTQAERKEARSGQRL